MTSFIVIIPAAGSGSRSGSDMPKQYVELAGMRVLDRAVLAFLACAECAEIVVAVDDQWRHVAATCGRGDQRVHLVTGGSTRQLSIANALAALVSDAQIVLVHDAARPCIRRETIQRVVDAATTHGAAIPVLVVSETVKRVDREGMVVETIPREDLRLAQTPQGFRRELIERAYDSATASGTTATDDASLVEALGNVVATVKGDPNNIKITLKEDFETVRRQVQDTTARSRDA